MNEKIKFQILKQEEIIDYLMKSFQLNFNRENMYKPESDFIVDLYLEVFSKLSIFKKDNILKLSVNETRNFSHNCGQIRNYTMCKLFKFVEPFITKILNIPDFSINDLAIPDPKRIRLILSSAINYHKQMIILKEEVKIYRDQKLIITEKSLKLREESEILKEKLESLIKNEEVERQRNLGYKEEFKIINEERKSIRQNLENLLNEKELLQLNFSKENSRQSNLQESLKITKTRALALKRSIIPDPDRIISTISTQEDTKKDIKNSIQKLQILLANSDNKLQNIKKIENNVNKFEARIEKLNINLEKNMGLINEIEEHHEKVIQKENEIKDCSQEIEIENRNYQNLRDSLQKVEEESRKKINEMLEENKFQKDVNENENKKLNEILKSLNTCHNSVLKKEKIVKEIESKIHESYLRGEEDFNFLENLVDHWKTNLDNEFNELSSFNN